MATRWAPEAWMNFQMWWPLVSGLVPHRMISLARLRSSGSIPADVPMVYRSPVAPAIEQIVAAWFEAPSTLKNRRPGYPPSPCR
jgi:hypothetical protein